MSGICLPIDASAGSPSFPAAQHRAAQSALMLSTSGRPLGARSGIRPGSLPSVSLAASVWTLTPFSAIADPGTGLAVGPYMVAFLANETGTLNPADGTNPRVDRLDVQVPDDPPGASPRSAVIVYTAGVAAASPVAPAAPARSFPLGTFTVPKSGAGSPSWSPAFALTVAAGGVLPVPGSAGYPSAPYVGQHIDDATLGPLRWNGSTWQQIGSSGVQTFTPVWTGLTVGNGTQVGEYQIVDKVMTLRTWLQFGSTTAISGPVSFAMPAGITAKNDGFAQDLLCRISSGSTGATRLLGFANIAPGSNSMSIWTPTSNTDAHIVQLGSIGETFGAGCSISVQGTMVLA